LKISKNKYNYSKAKKIIFMKNLSLFLLLSLVIFSCKNTYNEIEVADKSTSQFDVRAVNYFNSPKDLTIGNMAPNFIMNPDSDNPTELKDFRDNVVIIYIGASWCIYCRQFEPKLDEIYQSTKNDNLKIIKILTDYKEEDFIKKLSPDKEIYNVFNQWDLKNLITIYPNDYYPFYYLIDKFGMIRAKGNPNSPVFLNNLNALLKGE